MRANRLNLASMFAIVVFALWAGTTGMARQTSVSVAPRMCSLVASEADCGPYRKVCSNAKGETWCCNKDDICADTNGGCKKGDVNRKPGN